MERLLFVFFGSLFIAGTVAAQDDKAAANGKIKIEIFSRQNK